MPESAMPRSKRIFYGWYVVYAVCLVLTTMSGLGFYNLSVLLDAFVAERSFPVALASGATACYFIGSGTGGILAGWLIDRIDPRIVVIASACVSALALGSIGLLRDPVQLYVFHLVFGLAYGCGGLIPNVTVVARWFEARRPQALSIASTGLSLGGIAVTPLSAWLIEHHGIAGAAPWLGAAIFIGVVPLTALVVRPSPHAMGLVPDDAPRPNIGETVGPSSGTAFAPAMRSRFFIAVAASYFFVMGAQVGAIAHLYRLAKISVNGDIAAVAVALVASASVIGRLSGGWLLLKVSARAFTLVMFALQACALVVLSSAHDAAVLLIGTVLFGLSMGNVLMMQPLLLAEAFGTRCFGRIYSVSQFATMPGVAGGPALLGIIFALTEAYAAPYLVAAGGTVVGIAVLLLAGNPRRPR